MGKSHELDNSEQCDEGTIEFEDDPTKGLSVQETRRKILQRLGIVGVSLGLFGAGVGVDHKATGVEELKSKNAKLTSEVLRLSQKVDDLTTLSTLQYTDNLFSYVSDTQGLWEELTNEELDLSELGDALKNAIEESSKKDEEPLLTKLLSVNTRSGLGSKSEPIAYYISRIETFRNILSWLKKEKPDSTESPYLVAYAATRSLQLDSSEFLDPSPISACLLIDEVFSLQKSKVEFFGLGDITEDTLDPTMKLMRDMASQKIEENAHALGSVFQLPEDMTRKETFMYAFKIIAGEK